MMEKRDFDNTDITYAYSIDGEYTGDAEIGDGQSVKHPMYRTVYVTEKGVAWCVFVINDKIFANPVSYNLESDRESELVLSETETITGYDDETNQFYVTIPKSSEVILKVVDRIDAETLERLTIEEIDKL